MLKTTESSEKSAPKAFRADNNKVVWGGGGRVMKRSRIRLSPESQKIPTETSKFRNSKQFTKINVLSKLWYNSRPAHLNAQRSSSTGSLENSTLSGDGVEDGQVDELINWIIRELDPTAIAVRNDKVESSGGGGGRADGADEISAKSKTSKNFQRPKNLQRPDVWNNLPF